MPDTGTKKPPEKVRGATACFCAICPFQNWSGHMFKNVYKQLLRRERRKSISILVLSCYFSRGQIFGSPPDHLKFICGQANEQPIFRYRGGQPAYFHKVRALMPLINVKNGCPGSGREGTRLFLTFRNAAYWLQDAHYIKLLWFRHGFHLSCNAASGHINGNKAWTAGIGCAAIVTLINPHGFDINGFPVWPCHRDNYPELLAMLLCCAFWRSRITVQAHHYLTFNLSGVP